MARHYKGQPSLEYLAGLFDGEGHIGVGFAVMSKAPHLGKRFQSVHVVVTMTDRDLPRWFHQRYGGSFWAITLSAEGRARGWRQAWRWHATGKAAAQALTDLEPHLRLKRRHARLALRIGALKALGIPGHHNNPPVVRRKRRLINQLIRLNRGRPVRFKGTTLAIASRLRAYNRHLKPYLTDASVST